MNKIDEILHFWFEPSDDESRDKLWWGKNAEVDTFIASTFGKDLSNAIAGSYDNWAGIARGR